MQTYEAEHPDFCTLIPSEDNFYGINSTGKIGKFVQWVYVPAVKDAGEEGQEVKNSALGKLIARAVRTQTTFDDELKELKKETLAKYNEVLEKNREKLETLSDSLQKRLEAWAHPNAKIDLSWISDPDKSVQLIQPLAGIKTGDGEFLGSLSRMGHGLQRSYLLALLQELASSDSPDGPTLILGCEEPELYQHPPQARHLADVLTQLSETDHQVLVTTHAPLFVKGEGFEDVRLVRSGVASVGTSIAHVDYTTLCLKIREAMGDNRTRKLEGLLAKIHQTLQPHISEMFFARVPILVEGLEDASYITTGLHLLGKWDEFRRFGCQIIPVNGKDKLIQPVAIANHLGIPAFVVFDSDGNTERQDHRIKHERDNAAIIKLLGVNVAAFPDIDCLGPNYAIWKNSLTKAVEDDFGSDCNKYKEVSRQHYAQEGGLEKHDLFIADFLDAAHKDGKQSTSLDTLCEAILTFAKDSAVRIGA